MWPALRSGATRHRMIMRVRLIHCQLPALPGLTYALPDLSPSEVEYVRRQLERLASPERLFRVPPTGHAFSLSEPRSVTMDRVRHYYPSVLPLEKKWPEVMRKSLARPIYMERLVGALHDLNFPSLELEQFPAVLTRMSLPHLARDVELCRTLDVRFNHLWKRKRSLALRTHFLQAEWERLAQSLAQLDLAPQWVAAAGPKVAKGNLTYKEFHTTAAQALLSHLLPVDGTSVRGQDVSLPLSIDARSLARNFYLMQRVLGSDVTSTPRQFDCVLRLCPLETLVTLNSLYEQIQRLDPTITPGDVLNYFRSDGLNLVLRPSFNFPPLARVRLLQAIGFEDAEIVNILMSRVARFSDNSAMNKSGLGRIYHYDSHGYVPEFRRRLAILRADSNIVPQINGSNLFHALSNWKSFLKGIRAAGTAKNPSALLALKSPSIVQKSMEGVWWFHKLNNKLGVKFMIQYLDCEPRDAWKNFSSRFDNVLLDEVKECIAHLESLGYTTPQIQKAPQLLFFPIGVIDQQLVAMESNTRAFPDWSQAVLEDYILQACLYFIERQHGFSNTSDMIQLATNNSSIELSPDMEEECRVVVDGDTDVRPMRRVRSTSAKERAAKRSAGTSMANQPMALPAWDRADVGEPRHHGGFKHAVRFFSTSASRPSVEKFSDLVNETLYVNPLKMLQISSDFQKLKEWDPHMEKSTFVEATKQAISLVTQYLSQNNFEDLSGLLTKRERLRLKEEVETKWSDVQRNNINLSVDEIIGSFPDKVFQYNVAYQKFCDIDVIVPAWKYDSEGHRMAFVKIRARFSREYTENRLPEWTITKFAVERFKLLSEMGQETPEKK
eukprot:maker-scaffold123_size333416-snap-gene-2.15 protein:Tk05320 transcript:maker-scaffold123_size333416-snap-gene-2.15-mRNA-1 annotation:"hypothetical protein KGM_03861"